MTQNEIIKELSSLGIIAEIGGDFFITEKYKELLTNKNSIITAPERPERPAKLNYDLLLDGSTNGSNWPVEIQETVGRDRATALMNVCEVPVAAAKGYRLRGLDKDAINIVGNIIECDDIDPPTFITAIKIYYKHTEMPKGFKKLLVEGDALNIYNEFIAGTLEKTLKLNNPQSNQKWR